MATKASSPSNAVARPTSFRMNASSPPVAVLSRNPASGLRESTATGGEEAFMRKLVGLATALLGLLAFVAIATANTAGPSPLGQTQQLDVTHSPNKAGKGTKVIVDLHVRCDPAKVCQPPAGGLVAGPAGKASPVVNTVVHLPTGMKTGYKDFPK